eukprot:CAMPEP_0184686730 /NCGR_PEP_ID=MMETSP0312-20130426/23791_1 /TAXON_ID=31354 /ORGANISM="Compsopogon coeruleus, Strain SAG 36.94" /LENGTH=220 /DNA_ID=CAMNT_0027142157 /DNA_START=552 /DNA_END=1214 /DNA_ORIENTATION=+
MELSWMVLKGPSRYPSLAPCGSETSFISRPFSFGSNVTTQPSLSILEWALVPPKAEKFKDLILQGAKPTTSRMTLCSNVRLPCIQFPDARQVPPALPLSKPTAISVMATIRPRMHSSSPSLLSRFEQWSRRTSSMVEPNPGGQVEGADVSTKWTTGAVKPGVAARSTWSCVLDVSGLKQTQSSIHNQVDVGYSSPATLCGQSSRLARAETSVNGNADPMS